MKRDWSKAINLDLLCGAIKEFFEHKGFLVNVDKVANEFRFLILTPKLEGRRKIIKVNVINNVNGFCVEFIPSSSSAFSFLGYLLRFFGGGIFEKLSLEDREFLDRLEREFWVFVEEIVSSFEA
jgi:hypothetical protein